MRIPIKHFTGGEVDPQMGDRTRHACRHLENFIPQIYGNVERRPGTKLMYVSVIPYTPQPRFVGEYPTLRAVSTSADLGLTHTSAITTVTDLQNIKNDLDGNYYLTGDIDASATSTWNGGLGFDPIDGFYGTLDGCGYTISGLVIDRPAEGYVGIFGSAYYGAKIANLNLVDVDIHGETKVGALVGYLYSDNVNPAVYVRNCSVIGTVQFSGDNTGTIGGLIGLAFGHPSGGGVDITDCSSTCTVSPGTITDTGYWAIGGLIGWVWSKVTVHNCYATGDVDGGTNGSEVGGLIGEIYLACTITDSHATGDVAGNNLCGGFAGQMPITGGSVSRCYSTGDVTCVTDTGGGFCGAISGGEGSEAAITDCYSWGDVILTDSENDYSGGFVAEIGHGDFDNCYSIGSVTGTTLFGGFVGDTDVFSTITNCFWDTETSETETSDGGTGHLTLWMKTKPNYTGAEWDFDTIWYMPWEEV